MKISGMFIQRFGSVTNLDVPNGSTLTEGLNVIFGPNEAGKSQIKTFAEQILFPRVTGRSKVAQKPVGSIGFVHDGSSYLLESVAKGNKVQRELRRGGELLPDGMADLFPGLKVEGSEVFSNLYSFGLDELLLSTTLGERALSEHLFGAVAGGKGISISSVLDRLDDRIKKLIGGVSYGRNLEVILNDLTEKDRAISTQISNQNDFASRYKAREDLATTRGQAVSLMKAKRRELEILEQVENRRDQFLEYEAAKEFLDVHASLDALTPRLQEQIQNSFFQTKRMESSVDDLEERRSSCQRKSEVLNETLSSLDATRVQTARGILQDLVSKGETVSGMKENCEKEVALFDAGARQFDSELVYRIRLDVECNRDLKPEIDSLLDLRSDIYNLDTQRASKSLQLEVSDRTAIEEETRIVVNALADCKTLLLKIGSGSSTIGASKNLWIFTAGVLISLALGMSSAFGVLEKRIEIPFLSLAIALAIIFTGLIVSKTSRSSVFLDNDVGKALASIGVRSLNAFEISSKASELEDRKSTLSDLLQLDNHRLRISEVLAQYGLDVNSSLSLESVRRHVSALINLLKGAEVLQSTSASLAVAEQSLRNRKDELKSFLRELSDDSELTDDVSIDVLKVIVAGLVRKTELDGDHRAQIRAIDAEIEGYEDTLHKEVKLLHGLQESLAEDLSILRFPLEEMSEDLIELLTRYEQNRSVVSDFERIIHSQFQDLVEEAKMCFARSSPDVNQSILDLRADIELLNDEIEAIRTQETEITLEETRLLRTNPVIEIEEVRESLLLEAEDAIKELKYLVLARELLNNANSRFEEIHQPELLRLSSVIFSRVTQNRYSAIIKREDGPKEAIFARNANGEEVMDLDLSRGTREQLYISIRLALVSRADSLDLPLLMDDVMVNADVQRAEGLASELVKVSSSRQILYFCAKADTMQLFASVRGDVNLVELPRL